MGFPPRELRDLQLHVRAEQQTPDWKTRYAVRSGVEGTINEFAHGHGMRHCRYRGQPKTHLQHVLTAIAVNIERLSGLPPTEETPSPQPPTAFQTSWTSTASPGRSPGERWAVDLDLAPRSPTVRMREAPLGGLTRSPIDASAVLTLNRRPPERCHSAYRLGDRDLIGA
ncbi:transposase [Streptomyces sp. NPDC057748]|uniref:transposase n=1 Tax=unclassified Streptomyces TaxID=2593676 RepID=UPI0036C5D17D